MPSSARPDSSAQGDVFGVFPGQGTQTPGMGRRLTERFPEAGNVFDSASDCIGLDVRELCWNSSPAELARTQNAQVAIVTVALAAWKAWTTATTIQLAAVSGHSVGAVAAAVAAGFLSLADGLRLVRLRGELMAAAPREGSMIAVAITSDAARSEAIDLAEASDLDIAAVNGSRQIVVSGRSSSVYDLKERLGAKARLLEVSHGFHSRLMDPILDTWDSAVAATRFEERTRTKYVCSTTGMTTLDGRDVREDLRRGLRDTVRWDLVVARGRNWERWAAFGTAASLSRFARGPEAPLHMTTVDDSYRADPAS